jgi:hypothetical protein
MKLAISLACLLCAPFLAAQQSACLVEPKVTSTLPTDSATNDQPDFNCFGWQEFIALNWKADPKHPGQPDPSATSATFGDPNSKQSTVWETYKALSDIFLPDAKDPGGFDASAEVPASCKADYAKLKASLGSVHFMGMVDANPSLSRFVSKDIQQAGSHTWLTGQNHQLTYYEERTNEDEFNYIKQNAFYNALNQWKAMQPPGQGISLPIGPSSYGSAGAIEIKAAWLPIKDASLQSKYLMADALLWNPATQRCDHARVGLVGIHIIHKTAKAQQLAWATFEHLDNDPDANEVKAGVTHSYTYYNAKCDPATDHYKCQVNYPPCNVKTSQNKCTKQDPYDAPVQVVRVDPLPSYVNQLNGRVKQSIVTANPKSVFQYYRLINVLWPNQNTTIPPYALDPLYDGVPQPPNTQGGLLNTTMETYFQGDLDPQHRQQKLNCLNCHVSGAIAAQPKASNAACTVNSAPGTPSGKPPYPCASSYSFAFQKATCPKGSGCPAQ